AEPLIDEAKREWETVGPAAQILLDVISHHVNRGNSPAEAAKTVRAALDGSITPEAHLTDRAMNRVTVFAPFARLRHQNPHSLAASWAGRGPRNRTDRRGRT